MDFIDAKYSAGAAGLPLQAIQKQTMMEPTSRMDRLYNSVNSFHDGFRPGDEPPPKPKHGKRSSASKRRPPKWYHKKPDNHLARLGAGTHWPMPPVVELDDASEITEKWRLKLYECFHELDMFVRTRFDHAAFAIRSEIISDEALLNMVEEAWEATTKVDMIKDVFHGTTLPDNPKSGLEAWSEIFQGFSEDSLVPIPSYSLVSEGSHDDKFSQFKAFAHRHKVAFQIPALNLEKLTDRRLLLTLIVNRTLETPPYFARIDWEAMQIGRSGRLLSPPFCNGAFMSFFQGRDPNRDWYESGVESECRYLWGGRPESYEIRRHEKPKRLQHAAHGRFLRTDEPHRDSEAWKEDTTKALNQRGLVYGWGEGLLVLQAQTAIYRFCLELCHLAEKRNSDKAKFQMVPLLPAWPGNKKGCWNKNACINYGKAIRDQNAQMFPEQRTFHFSDISIEKSFLDNFRMGDPDATYSHDTIRRWRLDSDRRIRCIGRVSSMQLDQPGIEADYQYGCRPTRQPPRSHYEHLSDRCAGLHMYLRQRILLVLESPKEFIAMCRDGYNCHYGWIPDEGKDNNRHLLEHMVSTEFNAKKAMANDVIRRCLRFLVFGVEISCALEQLLQELKELMCPGADTPSGQNIEESVFVHPLDDAKTHRAFLKCVLHLRWFIEILFTHLHGQALIHGSASARLLCDRDHVSAESLLDQGPESLDKHGHRKYVPLPKGLTANNRPSVPKFNPNKSLPQPTDATADFGKLLQDVEKGPPNAQYGIPGIHRLAISISNRFDKLLTSMKEDQPFGSTPLVRDAILLIVRFGDVLHDMEMVDPLMSQRYVLNDDDLVREIKSECESNKVLEALDNFNFEEEMSSTVIQGVHSLLGVRYSNDDETEIPMEVAKRKLHEFKDSLLTFLNDTCNKQGLEYKSLEFVSDREQWELRQAREKALALVNNEDGELQPVENGDQVLQPVENGDEVLVPVENGDQVLQPVEIDDQVLQPVSMEDVVLQPANNKDEVLQLEYIFGQITTQDTDLSPQAVPPPLTGLKIGPTTVEISEQEAKRLAIKQATLNCVKRWQDKASEDDNIFPIPDSFIQNNNANAAPEKPGAVDRLSNRDWATVDDTFGRSAQQKGTIRWQHWENLFKHMGFNVTTSGGGSAAKFEWTPNSKIPEPPKKVVSLHKQHSSGGSASIEAYHVRDWCSKFRDNYNITAELIEKCYERGVPAAARAKRAPRAMMVRTVDDWEEMLAELQEWDDKHGMMGDVEEIDEWDSESEESASEDSLGPVSLKRKAVDRFDDLFDEEEEEEVVVEERVGGEDVQARRWKPAKVRFA